MARAVGRRLTRDAVLDAAVELVDETGAAGLTLAALAKRLGIRSPSLYNHVDGQAGLLRALRLRAVTALRQELADAAVGRSGSEALASLAGAYRRFARRRPGFYELTTRSTEGDDAELQAAGTATVEVVLAVLRGYGLAGADAVHATRMVRAALHGFAVLEASQGFGLQLSVDDSFSFTVAALDDALRAVAPSLA